MKTHINTIGVILVTLGSYLVWRYLTELNFADKDSYKQGQGVLVIPAPTPEDIAKFNLSVKLSKLGLSFIIVGGLLQVVSNYLPE
jgi:hypothetical protein